MMIAAPDPKNENEEKKADIPDDAAPVKKEMGGDAVVEKNEGDAVVEKNEGDAVGEKKEEENKQFYFEDPDLNLLNSFKDENYGEDK